MLRRLAILALTMPAALLVAGLQWLCEIPWEVDEDA